MLIVTATEITEHEAKEHNVDCDAVDYANILVAEQRDSDTFEGCTQIPVYSVALKPAEDMVIPFFVCKLHVNALKISLHEGVGVDEDAFGAFPNKS